MLVNRTRRSRGSNPKNAQHCAIHFWKEGRSGRIRPQSTGTYLNVNAKQREPCNVRAVKEQVFSAELELLKHNEDLNVLPRKLKKLREETSGDEELKILIQFIIHGWPDNRKEASKLDNSSKRAFDLYWNSHDELIYEDNIVYKGHRVMIPVAERQHHEKLVSITHRYRRHFETST